MAREELVMFVRKQIDKLKEQGIPDLMREGNVQKINELIQSIDYSGFDEHSRESTKPEFEVSELYIEDEDDIYATALYIWNNPYVEDGDVWFFHDCSEFADLMESKCGELGKNLSELLKTSYILTKYENKGFLTLTLEELLHPETVEIEDDE